MNQDKWLAELNELRDKLDLLERKISATSGSPIVSGPIDQQQPSPEPQSQTQRLAKPTIQPSFRNDPSSTFHPEKRFGTGGVLGVIGIFCFVLAASYFIQLAIAYGWLTPARQVLMAAVFAGVLIFCGFVFRSKDVQYVSMLPGAGIVILYMCAFGSGFYYKLTDQALTLTMISGISIFSIVLYYVFEEIFYVLIAAVGAYACPLLVDRSVISLTNFMVIFLVWDLTFAFLAVKHQRREINVVASYLALLIFFQQAFVAGLSGNFILIAYFQLAQFLVFFTALIKHSLDEQQGIRAAEAWTFFPLLILFYELEYLIVDRIYLYLAPWLSLGFAGLLLGIYFFAKKALKKNLESGPVIYAFCSIVFFQSVYWRNHASIHSPWFSVAILFALPYVNKKLNVFKKHPFLVICGFLILLCEYSKLLIQDLIIGSASFFEYVLMNLVMAGIFSFFYLKVDNENDRKNSSWTLILFLGYTQAMMGLSRIASQIQSSAGMPSDRLLTSILWIFLAILILMIGKFRRDAFFARTSLLVFGIAIAKVFFFDLSNTTPVMKIVSLIGIGATLFLGGYLYRHIETWEKPVRNP